MPQLRMFTRKIMHIYLKKSDNETIEYIALQLNISQQEHKYTLSPFLYPLMLKKKVLVSYQRKYFFKRSCFKYNFKSYFIVE